MNAPTSIRSVPARLVAATVLAVALVAAPATGASPTTRP